LSKLGTYGGKVTGKFDNATKKALVDFVNINNFENKMRDDGRIWKSVLDHLEEEAREA